MKEVGVSGALPRGGGLGGEQRGLGPRAMDFEFPRLLRGFVSGEEHNTKNKLKGFLCEKIVGFGTFI